MKSSFRNSTWFLFAVIIFYVFTAYQSSGFHNADEHFQIIEFANFKLGLAQPGDLAWEFNAQLRPGLQPALCFLLFKILHFVGITDVYVLAFILRAVTAVLAVLVVNYFINSTIINVDKKYRIAFVLLSYFLWFLPYINVRFSSETWSGLFFLISLALIGNKSTKTIHGNVLLGAVFGIAVLFRYQTALLVLGIVLWLIFVARIKFSAIAAVALSGFAVMVIGFFIDNWLYGEYTFTLYNYFHANIIQDVASNYGVSPWHEIIFYIVKAPGPIGIFIFSALVILIIRQPKNMILWAIMPFLLVHVLIPHKELRFLFPIANLVPLVLILACQQVMQGIDISAKKYKIAGMVLVILFVIINIAGLMVVSTKGAGNTKVSVTEYIHRSYAGKKVNVLYIEGLNPYSDWPFPKNTFYNSKEVALTPLVTIWQANLTEKKKNGYSNLLLISDNEITGPRTIAHLKKLYAVKVYQSIPLIDKQIISLYNQSLNDDNLMLYEIRD